MNETNNYGDKKLLEYNSERSQLALPEYGRNIQQMVNHCLTIEDRLLDSASDGQHSAATSRRGGFKAYSLGPLGNNERF